MLPKSACTEKQKINGSDHNKKAHHTSPTTKTHTQHSKHIIAEEHTCNSELKLDSATILTVKSQIFVRYLFSYISYF